MPRGLQLFEFEVCKSYSIDQSHNIRIRRKRKDVKYSKIQLNVKKQNTGTTRKKNKDHFKVRLKGVVRTVDDEEVILSSN